MLDDFEEVGPAGRMDLGIVHFLGAETIHCLQVVREFLVFEGWNGHLSQVNNQVAADNLEILGITFELINKIMH